MSAITTENSPVHDETPKKMETQENNSTIDLVKLLSGEKSRSSLTVKEIYDYLKNHHVPMKGDTLFKKLGANKSSSFFLSFKMKWLKENPWLVNNKELEGGLCKFCVLFDEKDSKQGIFVKRTFQVAGKSEKIRE